MQVGGLVNILFEKNKEGAVYRTHLSLFTFPHSLLSVISFYVQILYNFKIYSSLEVLNNHEIKNPLQHMTLKTDE